MHSSDNYANLGHDYKEMIMAAMCHPTNKTGIDKNNFSRLKREISIDTAVANEDQGHTHNC